MKQRKDQAGIDGENDAERIALKVFYGEFVFSDLWYSNKEVGLETNIELADLISNLGNNFLAFQVKTRKGTPVEGGDKKWVANKVKKAKDQLVETYKNLQIGGLPEFVNKKNDKIFLEKEGVFSGIIILKNEGVVEYPKIIECKRLKGIIHCFTEKDFNTCCERLVIPSDILKYLYYRERYYELDKEILEEETICIDGFLKETYGVTEFDNNAVESFKWILNKFKDRLVEKNRGSIEYRDIVQVLAMFNRTEIDTFTNIFAKLLNGARKNQFTDHMFMKPVDVKKYSILFLSMGELDIEHAKRVTHLFMYRVRSDKCLTVILHMEDDINFEIYWLLIERPWEKDIGMESLIKELGIQNKWIPKKIITGKLERN